MPPARMIADANTWGLYRFDEAANANAIDYSGNGRDLTVVGTPATATGLIGGARVLTSADKFTRTSDGSEVSLLSHGMTIEALIKIPTGGGGPIVAFERKSDAIWGALFKAYHPTYMDVGGSGGVTGFASVIFDPAPFASDAWHYFAWSIWGGSGSTGGIQPPPTSNFVNFAIDGSIYSRPQGSGFAAASGTELVVGDWYATPSTFATAGLGLTINELKISNVCRTPKEFADQAVAYGLLGSLGSTPSVIAPVVGNFVPALNTPRQPSDPIQFDVTVSDGTPFVNISINFQFEGLPIEEGAFDGADFSPLYTGISTKTAITNGFRFVFKRRGGWPNSPGLKVRAVTASGMVNV